MLDGNPPQMHTSTSQPSSPSEETKHLQHSVRMLQEEVSTLQLQLDQQASANVQKVQELQVRNVLLSSL